MLVDEVSGAFVLRSCTDVHVCFSLDGVHHGSEMSVFRERAVHNFITAGESIRRERDYVLARWRNPVDCCDELAVGSQPCCFFFFSYSSLLHPSCFIIFYFLIKEEGGLKSEAFLFRKHRLAFFLSFFFLISVAAGFMVLW